MTRTLRIATTVVALVLGTLGAPFQAPTPFAHAGEQSALQRRAVTVDNMTCAACPITVRAAMSRVEGVRSVEIDLDSKTATVTFDPSLTSIDEIARASTNAGYPAEAAGG